MAWLRTFSIARLILRSGVLLDLPPIRDRAPFRALLGFFESADHQRQTPARRLRELLTALGPIPVKFGQILSTRPDLIGVEYAQELSLLQDRVPPFANALAKQIVETELKAPLTAIFEQFDDEPIASASIAQVHFAKLKSGEEVAVKIVRPNIKRQIARDVAVLRLLAKALHRLWRDGRLLRLPEVVEEFNRHLQIEIDLMFEAANASQLRRNFEKSKTMSVPKIYFDWCTVAVMVSERIRGIPIADKDGLIRAGINLQTLAKNGTEIFFTQVFRDGFFHADMHPGNIFVLSDGRYCAIDFGIMGALADTDKMYLAQNFLAFFNRDYRKVAVAHVEAGWAPRNTNIEAFTGAVRAACEPIFDKPIKDISFGKLLFRLFQISRQFGVEEQPQLVMLQKTLFNIEGLGRELYPDLDLWEVAKPYLENWMREQIGWRALVRKTREEAPYWAGVLPELPRRLHQHLSLQVRKLEQEKDHPPPPTPFPTWAGLLLISHSVLILLLLLMLWRLLAY